MNKIRIVTKTNIRIGRIPPPPQSRPIPFSIPDPSYPLPTGTNRIDTESDPNRNGVSISVSIGSAASLIAGITWIVRFLTDFSAPPSLPIPLHCDNQATIHIAKNLVFH